ncbi:MAG: hypothetical protein GX860_05730 [Alcaligenaceae bacterium]|nr:hypothetical protein [Alcaligenaceae bacterium]
MSYQQEKSFIKGLESFTFGTQDLSEQQQELESWQTALETFLQTHEFNTEGLKKQHPISQVISQLSTKKEQYLPAWEQSKKELNPALDLAESFADKLMFLVFGKFNAGKSSFCNLIADRFKFHDKQVQPFILENGQIQYHDQAFQEGSTETTAHIQGVILNNRLVLIDTPGLHSITAENAALTQQFLESADGILWLSSSTSPGQVQELEELAQEIRRRKPLLPVITRSDFIDEVFVDNDIKKVLCNKSPENRAIQEEDVLQRAQDKLTSLGMDADLVQQPISISVYFARQHGLTDESLSNGGLYSLYQALLSLSEPVIAYKERKPLEVFMHYLEEVVLRDIDSLIEEINQLKALYQAETEQLTASVEAIKTTVWQSTLSKLPTLMDKLITTASDDPTMHFNRDFREAVKENLKIALNHNFAIYDFDQDELLAKTQYLGTDIKLNSENYEKFYLAIEENLQEQLESYGNFLTAQAEESLERIAEQLIQLREHLEKRKQTLTLLSQ